MTRIIQRSYKKIRNTMKYHKSRLLVLALTLILVLGSVGCGTPAYADMNESEQAGTEVTVDQDNVATPSDEAESKQMDASQDSTDTKTNEGEDGQTKVYKEGPAKKLDERVSWVLRVKSDGTYEVNYREGKYYQVYFSGPYRPYINIDSEYAVKINQEIKDLYDDWYNEMDMTSYGYPMDYSYHISGNILSVVIYRPYTRNLCPYCAYNINLDTSCEASLEEVYQACGFKTLSELEDKVKIAIYNDDEGNLSDSASWNGIDGTYYLDDSGVFQILAFDCNDHLTSIPVRNDLTYTDSEVHITVHKVDDKLVVEGRDYSNDNVLWKYTTENDAPLECREDTYLGYITSHRGKVYLCDWSKLCVLDAKTGKVINRDDTYIGWAQRYVFDDDGDFYVTSYLANLNRFDENGKNLCYTSALHDYFISDNYAIKLRIDGDKLIVDFDEGGSITFDKDTLEVISRDKEPNV